jgi:hypothetical protein
MKDEDIRKQIEDECKDCKKIITCFMCTRDKLIESRKTIQSAEERIQAKDSVIKLLQEQIKAKQESLERFILGERE